MSLFHIFLLSLAISSVSQAAITLSTISGVSVLNTTSADGTTTTWEVFGGIQTGRAMSAFPSCTSNTSTCDTCDGTVVGGPCNKAGVFTDTYVTFSASQTGATGKWLLCDSGTEIESTTNLSTALAVQWQDICTQIGATAACTTDASKTLTFGAAADCNALSSGAAENRVSIKFNVRDIDLTVASTNPVPCAGTENGACGFGVEPGDEKVYLAQDYITVNSDTGESVDYTKIIFFIAEQDPSEVGNDQTTFDRITNAYDFAEFAITSDGNAIDGSFIDDLKNDVVFCFKMASMDAAGNIEKISSNDCIGGDCNSSTTAANVCMMPSEVVGILSDKKCFIATAAFGSDMSDQVKMLREFRNEFMAPYWIGRKLIKLYYKISPPLAQLVSKNESSKTFVQWLLWPVMIWAQLALDYGWAVVALPFLALGLAVVVIKRRRAGL